MGWKIEAYFWTQTLEKHSAARPTVVHQINSEVRHWKSKFKAEKLTDFSLISKCQTRNQQASRLYS